MRIETLRLKNYRVFQDVTVKNIPEFCVIVGANGTGKSTFFDVFNFLQEALRDDVAEALEQRGGFSEVVSRGQTGPIEMELGCRTADNFFVKYYLQITSAKDKNHPIINYEFIEVEKNPDDGPVRILNSLNGNIWLDNGTETDNLFTENYSALNLNAFGYFKDKYPTGNELRNFLENWHVSDIQIQNTRDRQKNGMSTRVSRTGDNLYQVARYLYENEPERFEEIERTMMERIPGIHTITVEPTPDKHLLLRFNDGSFKDPFLAKYVSDGTLKMFAYLVLLNAPKHVPLLAVEEPENQIYSNLMAFLAEDFRAYALEGGQVFVSTHSPEFLNHVELEEVYWLSKKDGYTIIRRAADDPQLRAFIDDGDVMGHLWYIGLFEGVDPS